MSKATDDSPVRATRGHEEISQVTPSLAPAERPPIRVAFSTIVIACVVFWGLYLVGIFFAQFIEVMLIIFLTILLSTFIHPVVTAMERLHLHRGISILLIYLAIVGVFLLVGRLAFPLFVSETQALVNRIPTELQHLAGPLRSIGINLPTGAAHSIKLQSLFSSSGRSVTNIAGQAVGLIFTVGYLLASMLAMLAMTFFLTVNKTTTSDLVNALVPPPYRKRTVAILSEMGERMGRWVVGQLVITVYYAIAFSSGLTLLHIPYSISVGVITGVLEIIPFVGGFVGAGLAMIIAATVSPIHILLVFGLYLLVTNIEAHIIVPNIYSRSVHLHPALVIISLLVGAVSFGILGALIAVPAAAALQVAVENLYVQDVVDAAEKQQPPIRPGPGINLWRRRPRLPRR